MLKLDVWGELEMVTTFPGRLTDELFRNACITTAAGHQLFGEVLEFLSSRKREARYMQEIRRLMNEFEERQQVTDLDHRRLMSVLRSPMWHSVRDDVLHGLWLTHQRGWLIRGLFKEFCRYLQRKTNRMLGIRF